MDVNQKVTAVMPGSQSTETAAEKELMSKSTASGNLEKLPQLEQATTSSASTSQEEPAAEVESSWQEQVEAEKAPSSPIQPAVEVEEESEEPSLVSGKAPLKPV